MKENLSHDPAMPAFLFDLDGTLIDGVCQHVLAWHEALEITGLRYPVCRLRLRLLSDACSQYGVL
jgi:beta-phosphoglucomutase-like phosphatase (HAD superfamily)